MALQPALPTVAHHRLRLETLIRLRWLAVVGQTAGVVFVAFGLGFDLPLTPCLALIALSAGLNLVLLLRFPATLRLRSHFAAVLLAYDSAQLAALLYLTGGLQNPFSILLLAPVSVSATTLPQRWTTTLAILAVGLATILTVFHMPLPWFAGQPIQLEPLYVGGIWVGIVSGILFTAVYTNRVAHEARQLADALTATELVLAREQHLSVLDGLAAAAAHELGTPLATIALAAREMQTDLSDTEALKEDVDLIAEQAARCRAILTKLRSLDAHDETMFGSISLTDLVAEVIEPHRDFGVVISIEKGRTSGEEPRIRRNAGLLYGLGNLIENAIDYAKTATDITLEWTAETVRIVITDDGPGFPPDLVTKLGEPYLTTRPSDRSDSDPTEPGGLGLGIFIAKTLLERSGATLSFGNKSLDGRAQVVIRWPRPAVEYKEVAQQSDPAL
ncbi:ActS/PrrB/RegB family redox-sensitive histidine kinase [Cucumibacter marinus]|uniref:ActS/PrrB/RegB family redox-sensitive histidine kinase n=1 Tax=Cucumibacter marinus TaxID=1121252 RepID=UPI00042494DF|nr:ActS/PrrB/RegB family redox-sensitive histidine kinase [Cucumibacter marinus]